MHEINVVPYVDVMLVLLVIFMVTAPLITPGLIELPSVSQAPVVPVAPIEVIVKRDQTLVLRTRDPKTGDADERPIARQDLARLVRERQGAAPDTPVVIAADKDVRYEAVLNVMDELQRSAVRRVGLLVQPAK
ncbi:MAG: ExbD/TolR family protein [Burkholderiales bacterium]|nr:ExbD/TolR family protein [Burkholderiales bacterium]